MPSQLYASVTVRIRSRRVDLHRIKHRVYNIVNFNAGPSNNLQVIPKFFGVSHCSKNTLHKVSGLSLDCGSVTRHSPDDLGLYTVIQRFVIVKM